MSVGRCENRGRPEVLYRPDNWRAPAEQDDYLTTDRSRFESWLDALDQRHLANLTPSEVTRALRALSSCYVERREKLASGGPLDSAGKRAAFALFYAPLHFMIAERIVTGLNAAASIKRLLDLGC